MFNYESKRVSNHDLHRHPRTPSAIIPISCFYSAAIIWKSYLCDIRVTCLPVYQYQKIAIHLRAIYSIVINNTPKQSRLLNVITISAVRVINSE